MEICSGEKTDHDEIVFDGRASKKTACPMCALIQEISASQEMVEKSAEDLREDIATIRELFCVSNNSDWEPEINLMDVPEDAVFEVTYTEPNNTLIKHVVHQPARRVAKLLNELASIADDLEACEWPS